MPSGRRPEESQDLVPLSPHWPAIQAPCRVQLKPLRLFEKAAKTKKIASRQIVMSSFSLDGVSCVSKGPARDQKKTEATLPDPTLLQPVETAFHHL